MIKSEIIAQIDNWVIVPQEQTHYKMYYSEEHKISKWVGCTDPNYSFDGDRLSWERTVKDEDGKDVIVKTYKEPIEIIADFKPKTEVYGIDGNIGKKAVEKFGGGLKGFIWFDKVNGGGEVTLPFTAPYIFIATGDRLNPELTEILTDSNADNYYEIVEGRTRVFVKSFSGIGGAAGASPSLIAHYKMNEDTANDNDELVSDGDFDGIPAGVWTLQTGWSIAGEVAHCDGTQTGSSHIYQNLGLIANKKYRYSFTISNYAFGSVKLYLGEGVHSGSKSANGTFTGFLVRGSNPYIYLRANVDFVGDIDDVSVKLCVIEDSSGNGHDGIAQQDTDQIHRTGKINGAFDFNGTTDYINTGDTFQSTFQKSFSISLWCKPTDGHPTNSGWFFGISTATEDDCVWMLLGNTGNLIFQYSSNGNRGRLFVNGGIPLLSNGQETWHHLVMVVDSTIRAIGGVKGYFDGILQPVGALSKGDTTDVVSADFRSTINPFIGAEDLSGATNFYNGLIDNVILFSVVLTPDEVRILFNAGSGTENLVELDQEISPRRSNLSIHALRRRYEFA